MPPYIRPNPPQPDVNTGQNGRPPSTPKNYGPMPPVPPAPPPGAGPAPVSAAPFRMPPAPAPGFTPTPSPGVSAQPRAATPGFTPAVPPLAMAPSAPKTPTTAPVAAPMPGQTQPQSAGGAAQFPGAVAYQPPDPAQQAAQATAAHAAALKQFGSHPFAAFADAPAPPVTPGGLHFNPFAAGGAGWSDGYRSK